MMRFFTGTPAMFYKPIRWLGNVYVLLVAASVVYCAGLFGGLDNWGHRDWDLKMFRYATPRLAMLRDCELPLWNPYVNGGTVHLGHPQSPALSPWYLPVLLLGVPLGVRIQVLLFMALGATGMAALLRRWNVSSAGCFTAGVVLMMSSHYVLHITEGHLEWCGLGLMPWVFLCLVRAERDWRFVIWGALVFSTAVLHGMVYITAVFVPFFCVWAVLRRFRTGSWRTAASCIAMIGLTFLLGAVVMLPRLELTGVHPRGREVSDRITPAVLARMFLDPGQAGLYRATRDPQFPRNSWLAEQKMECDWHEYGCYITWLALAMAAVGIAASFRLRWPLYAAGATAGLVMLGADSPIDLWTLMGQLPVYGSLQVSTRFLAAVVFVLAIAAGLGVDWLGRQGEKSGGHWLGRFLPAGVALAVYVELAVLGGNLFSDIFVYPPRTVNNIGKSFDRFAQRFAADKALRYPTMYSAHYPYLLSNSGVLHNYEFFTVRRGDVRVTTDPDYRGEAYLQDSHGTARITDWSMSCVKVSLRVDAPDRLVLNQNYFSGWKATRQGRTEGTERLLAEPSPGGLISICVRPGDRKVEFYYLPGSFLSGALVSGLTLFGCLAALVVGGISRAPTQAAIRALEPEGPDLI